MTVCCTRYFLLYFMCVAQRGFFFCEKDKIFENCVDHSTLNGLKMGGDKKLIEIWLEGNISSNQ